MRVPVAIVGGGITGLAAAQRLAERGASFLLLEAEERLGGKIRTERVEGFVLEGGPDCFLSIKPAGLALCRALGIEDRLQGTDPAFARAFVKRKGRLHELPEGMSGLVPSRILPLLTTPLLSPLGRLRAAVEPLVPARRTGADETIASFASRRLGRETYEWLVEPLLSGIYAGDGRALSLEATFPQLAALERERGSLLRAMVRRPRSGRGTVPPPFVTPRGGLGEIVEAVASRLPRESLRLGAAVERLEEEGDGFRLHLAGGEGIACDSVLLATPAFAAAKTLGPLDADLARALSEIPFVSTATVSLAFPAPAVPRRLDGYGYLSPRAEGGPLVACTWTSNKFPARVPAGHVLVRLFLGRAGMEGVLRREDEELLAFARRELEALFGISAPPSLERVFRWPRGMPQYTVGHRARLERIERLLAGHPGLHLAGCSYRGVGIPDCIASGWGAADAVLRSARVVA
ncbi:MAG: protoporphyrinogen oxidase [Planctomycetota bacterium]